MIEWTNDMAIQQWGTMPRELLEKSAHDGDYAKRHLINPVVLRMLGDVRGRRVLDAGCGNGYLSRMLATRGALISLGCALTELAEPGLAPELVADGPAGIDAYVHLPNFLVIAARRGAGSPDHTNPTGSGRGERLP